MDAGPSSFPLLKPPTFIYPSNAPVGGYDPPSTNAPTPTTAKAPRKPRRDKGIKRGPKAVTSADAEVVFNGTAAEVINYVDPDPYFPNLPTGEMLDTTAAAAPSAVALGKRKAVEEDGVRVKRKHTKKDKGETPSTFLLDDVTDATTAMDLSEKPPIPRMPYIWAKSRQEVCESLEYFKSYQGGVYFNSGVAKGYLLSAFSSSRDRYEREGKLIISHGGGSAEAIRKQDGESSSQASKDQTSTDKSVGALMATFHKTSPIALIIDDKYSLFPFRLGSQEDVAYAVLGWYQIAEAWAEKHLESDGRTVVRYKFAFQWVESQGVPWWVEGAADAPTSPPRPVKARVLVPARPPPPRLIDVARELPKRLNKICIYCRKPSPKVYTNQMCLQPLCTEFWQIPHDGSTSTPTDTELEYDPEFFELIELNCPPLPDLRPSLPKIKTEMDLANESYSEAFSRGWHCRKCGRLSPRFRWQFWECLTCGNTHTVSAKIYIPNGTESYGIRKVTINDPTIIEGNIQMKGNKGNCMTYTLPHNRGKIHQIFGTSVLNAEATEIFQEYQKCAIDGRLAFKRYPLRAHKLRGNMLTNYFAQNTGEPYQYVGGSEDTVSWDHDNSSGPRKARALIQRRILELLEQDVTFNELLSVAYMQKQSMAFHSDAEKGLGPVVAGLSMGSSAKMHFRPVDKKERIHGNSLTLTLMHGDVLVMEGHGVQTYYQHTVDPNNFRIAATARNINMTTAST